MIGSPLVEEHDKSWWGEKGKLTLPLLSAKIYPSELVGLVGAKIEMRYASYAPSRPAPMPIMHNPNPGTRTDEKGVGHDVTGIYKR